MNPIASPLEIEIEPDVREEIYDHVFSSLEHEVGGVLLGPATADGPVTVSARVEAIEADNQQASVTFTHESWAAIYREMEERYPSLSIVGWYHSHPGFGIFLSDHDIFIHENFFPGVRQVAYVVDPRAATEGFFGWDDGQVTKLVEQDAPGRTPQSIRGDGADRNGLDQTSGSKGRRAVTTIGVLVLGLIAGGAAAILLSVDGSAPKTPPTPPTITEPEITKPNSPFPPVVRPGQQHEVQPGETLFGILRDFDVPSDYLGAIEYVNDIKDANLIEIGQKIAIPDAADLGALQAWADKLKTAGTK
jgi:proteasome lid subunit RPN8/RPN11/LysM repeat protein